MTGSLRQRGPDAWELRTYLGVDASSGRERWATKTLHGTRQRSGHRRLTSYNGLLRRLRLPDPDFATYLRLAASTGARRSQMLGLRWADIDFAHSAGRRLTDTIAATPAVRFEIVDLGGRV